MMLLLKHHKVSGTYDFPLIKLCPSPKMLVIYYCIHHLLPDWITQMLHFLESECPVDQSPKDFLNNVARVVTLSFRDSHISDITYRCPQWPIG